MLQCKKKIIAVSTFIIALVGIGILSFRLHVRNKIVKKAAVYGAEMRIGAVWPSWRGVDVKEVSLNFKEAPGIYIYLDRVQFSLSWRGQISAIVLTGGLIRLDGSFNSIAQQIEATWGHVRMPPTNENHREIAIEIKDIDLQWKNPGTKESIQLRDISLKRSGWDWALTVNEVKGEQKNIRWEGDGFKSHGFHHKGIWHIARLSLENMHIRMDRISNETGRPPSDPGQKYLSGTTLSTEYGISQYEQVLRAIALLLEGRIDGLTDIGVKSLQLESNEGPNSLHVGPGAFMISHRPKGLSMNFMSNQEGVKDHPISSTPLQVQLDIPKEPSESIVLAMQGGPVTLAALGLKDRDMGLLEVDKSILELQVHVSLSPQEHQVEVSSRGEISGVSLENSKLSHNPLRNISMRFHVDADGKLDGSPINIHPSEIDFGNMRIEVQGHAEWTREARALRGQIAIPSCDCQSLLDAMPTGLVPQLSGMHMAGSFSLFAGIDFNSAYSSDALVDFRATNGCRVTEVPAELNVARFRRLFRYQGYTPDGKPVELESGPGSVGWVPLGAISSFVEGALSVTEDGAFRSHRGFSYEAIRNSIREDLKTGSFQRGASTISMQTAKNIYLARDKTLSRKIQEAVLTTYLEQELSKDEILELYLNCIEFGPMVYGIAAAADYYFHAVPAQLSVSQSLFLTSILPNPKQKPFGSDGRLSAGRMKSLYRLMQVMAQRHLITREELTQGLSEWVVAGSAKPMYIKKSANSESSDEAGAIEGPLC